MGDVGVARDFWELLTLKDWGVSAANLGSKNDWDALAEIKESVRSIAVDDDFEVATTVAESMLQPVEARLRFEVGTTTTAVVKWIRLRDLVARRGAIDLVPARLVRPPGGRLLEAANWFLSAKTVGLIVGQAVADMREAHAQALADGLPRKARWVEIRDTLGILLALAQLAWHKVGKFLLGFLKVVS